MDDMIKNLIQSAKLFGGVARIKSEIDDATVEISVYVNEKTDHEIMVELIEYAVEHDEKLLALIQKISAK